MENTIEEIGRQLSLMNISMEGIFCVGNSDDFHDIPDWDEDNISLRLEQLSEMFKLLNRFDNVKIYPMSSIITSAKINTSEDIEETSLSLSIEEYGVKLRLVHSNKKITITMNPCLLIPYLPKLGKPTYLETCTSEENGISKGICMFSKEDAEKFMHMMI